MKRGHNGTSMSGREVSPARRRRRDRARRRQEAEWRARNGPVTVRRIGDDDRTDRP